MATYLETQGIRVSRIGSRQRCFCPFHSERTPSFYIDPNDDHGYCHGGCPDDRSYYDLVELIYRLEFPNDPTRRRAFQRAKELGANVPSGDRTPSLPRESPLPTVEQSRAMTIAFEFYRELLWKNVGAPARHWLFVTRGLRGPLRDKALESVGFAPGSRYYHEQLVARLKAEFGEESWEQVATTTGIIGVKGYQRLRNRVIFAVRDPKGNVLFYQGRTILSERELAKKAEEGYAVAKHLNAPGLRKLPFIPITQEDAIYPGTCIDEGPMDALAHGVCGFYSYGLLGSRVPTLQTLRSLPKPIIGGLDNAEKEDEAGPSGQRELMKKCHGDGLPFVDGHPPRIFKDQSEWLQKDGPDRFTEGNTGWMSDLAA